MCYKVRNHTQVIQWELFDHSYHQCVSKYNYVKISYIWITCPPDYICVKCFKYIQFTIFCLPFSSFKSGVAYKTQDLKVLLCNCFLFISPFSYLVFIFLASSSSSSTLCIPYSPNIKAIIWKFKSLMKYHNQ